MDQSPNMSEGRAHREYRTHSNAGLWHAVLIHVERQVPRFTKACFWPDCEFAASPRSLQLAGFLAETNRSGEVRLGRLYGKHLWEK